MKLERVNKYWGYAVLLSYTILVGSNFFIPEIEEPVIENIESIPTYEPKKIYMDFNEENIEESIQELKIEDNNKYLSNVYKVITFKDSNDYYKVMIVTTKVDFYEDANGLQEIYTVYDAFSKEHLFVTRDFKNITSINSNFDNSIILSYDNLDKLGDIAINLGLNRNYVDEAMKIDTSLSSLDVAYMYTSLIPSNFRTTYNYLENGNKVMHK